MTTEESSTERPQLRVLTMNIYGPGNPRWEARHRLIGRTIAELSPDVVALQEVPVDRPDLIERLVGPGFHFSHFSRPSDDGVAGTLATRWPHDLVTELDLRLPGRSHDAPPWCAAVVVELDTPVGRVVVAHHKPTWPKPYELEREHQAVMTVRTLEEHIGSRKDLHAVVLGDFDSTPDAASLQFWRGLRSSADISVCYQDVWEYLHPDEPGWTMEHSNPLVAEGEVATVVNRRIDHVLVRSGRHGPTLQATACRRVLDGPVDGVWASDHYGVLADLARPERPPGFRS
jgi:endonuclease/exonuclease/phosphatase family metal-dependent hydrolase